MLPAIRLIAALALSLATAAASAAAPGAVLVLGRVSDNPKVDYARLRPMLDYVVPKLADVGIREGRILMARDTQQMSSYLRRGKVDWLSETAGAAVTWQERAGAHLLLQSGRGGMWSYQSVFFARADSGIRSLADLRGRAIAFQNAASTSSYFLPAAEILGAGVPLVVLASPSDRPSADVAGFVFARSELNISTWVHKGLVDAGAYGEQDWLDPERNPAAFRSDLVVFHRSPAVPRAVEVVRGDLDPRVAARLREVLLAAPGDPAALAGLRAMWNTTGYRPVDADAERALADFQRGVARIPRGGRVMPAFGLKGRYALVVVVGLMLLAALLWSGARVQAEGDRRMAALAAEEVQSVGRAALEQRARTLAHLLAEALTNPVYFVDLEAIGEFTRPVLEEPDVAYVLVFDREGRILHDGSASIAAFGQLMDGPLAARATAATRAVVQDGQTAVDVTEPMFLGGERLGGVRVGLSRATYEAAAREAGDAMLRSADAVAGQRLRALLWPLAGLLGLIVFGLWLVATRLVRPIRQAAAYARALEEGRLVQRIDVSRRDEIGDLMRSMGALGASLSAHDRDVRRLAYVDSLTGLPNRLMLREALARAMMVGRSSGTGIALLFIDLDDFKRINDTLGHDAGDEALAQIAHRLEGRLAGIRLPAQPEVTGSTGDMVARFGGDEFVALLFGGDLRSRARQFAEGVFEAVREPLSAGGRSVHLNASIGITLFPDDGDDPQQLLKSGDIAMYEAKQAGKNCYRYFTPAMTRAAEDRLHLEHDLREAMAGGQLAVHYQPIVDLRSGRLAGAEALLRWAHPQRGMVAPSLFVGIAEDFGLIGEIGRFVLERACADAAQWPVDGLDGAPFVSVNLSVRQLRDPGLPREIAATLARHGLPHSRVHVELTESALLDSEPLALTALAELRRLGIRIWLDDFGTGFSGLSHLRRVPVDGVKIDRSFVQELLTDRDDLALTSAIVAMAGSLGIEAIAEGIESEAQLEVLRNLRCDLGQGFWLGHPVPQAALLVRMRKA